MSYLNNDIVNPATIMRMWKPMTISELYHLVKNDKIAYPIEIQRSEVWKTMMKQLFIYSSFAGFNLSSIILLDLKTCVEWCQIYGKKADVKYFQEFLEQGYTHINNDGQQKTWSYVRFLGGEFALDEFKLNYVQYELNQFALDDKGKLKYPNFPYENEEKTRLIPNWCGTKQSWDFDFKNQAKTWNQLPLEFQEAYKSQIIPIVMILGCTKKQAHLIFNLINVGVAQNDQEFRNAFDILVARIIRNLGAKFEKLYTHLLSPEDIKRKGVDENIVWKADWYVRKGIITPERIDGYKKQQFFEYITDDFMYKEHPIHLKFIKDSTNEKTGKVTKSEFHKVLEQNMNCYKQFSKKLAKWGWRQDFTWFQILVTLSENYKFSDESRAFAIFYEQEVARRADNDTIVYKHEGGTKTYSGCSSKTNPALMKLVLEIALGDFVNNEEVQELMSAKTSSIRKQPTVKDKVTAFIQQGGTPGNKDKLAKNPVDNTDISLIDVLNTNMYELDHLKYLDGGGSDTVENKFLISTAQHKLKTKLERQGVIFETVEDYKKLMPSNSSLQLAA